MSERQILIGSRSIEPDRLLLNGRRAATGLFEMGVREDDSVALLLRNDFAFIEAIQGAILLGAYAVPINWHFKSDEVRYILDDSRPKVLVAHADLLAQVRGVIPEGLPILIVPTPPEVQADFHVSEEHCGLPAGETEWSSWLNRFEAWNEPPRSSRNAIIYTSGTTGIPKAVRRKPLTAEQSAGMARMFQLVYGVQPGMRALVAGPLYHTSPIGFTRQAIHNSEVLILLSRFDAEETLATIERFRISHAVMVPTMLVRMLKLPEDVRKKYDLSSLRWIIHTAAPCPSEVKRAIIEWLGPIIHDTYGATETGFATHCSSEEWLAHPGTVGRPLEGVTLCIYDDNGNEVPPGGVGEIYMRNIAWPDFTYEKQEAKRREIERDGLISVGDMGYLQDGFLYVCDRKVDMVISGGVNIYPAEIEAALLQCPQVRDCAVFGIPDDDFGESLMAAIEPSPDAILTEEVVMDFLKERIAKYKIPRFIKFHSSLPREDSGKIFKRKLRDPYWQNKERLI